MASAEFINGDAIKAKLIALQMAKANALKAAGLAVLTASQQSIIQSGPGWEPQKRPYKPPHMLLWEHGTLLRSLALGGSDNIFQQNDNTITLGTAVSYAGYLNDGTKNMVARKFLYLDDARLQLAKDAYLNVLKKAWQNG